MSEYRNQHFVPRAHLRPFAHGEEGRAINLHLIASGKQVFGASTKKQCARPFFYGADGKLERILGQVEGSYAAVVKRLEVPGAKLTPEDSTFLRYFTLLQSLRTEEQVLRALAQAKRFWDHLRLAHEAHGEAWLEEAPSLEWAMEMLMSSFEEQLRNNSISDLKVVIVRNDTQRSFVTSDDPAVLTNRWQLQRKKNQVFGTNSAGAVLILPLGPRLLSMCYDPAVYTISSYVGGGIAKVRSLNDVYAFNKHQYMRAASAIYFCQSQEAGAIAADFEAAKAFRPAAWEAFQVAERIEHAESAAIFKVGNPEEVAKADEQMFHMTRETPCPGSWPSILQVRHDAHGFTKGRKIVRRVYKYRDIQNYDRYRRIS